VLLKKHEGYDRSKVEKPKRSGAGKGNWGNPKDDIKFLGEPIIEKNDLLYYDSAEEELAEDTYYEEAVGPAPEEIDGLEPPQNTRQLSVGKKLLKMSEFNVKIKQTLEDCLVAEDPTIFVERILEMEEKNIHSGVFRLLLLTCTIKPPHERAILMEIIDGFFEKKLLSSMEATQELQVTFSRAPSFVESSLTETPLEILTSVARFCVERGRLGEDFFDSVVFQEKAENLKKAKALITDIMREFFSSSDINDVCNSLEKIQACYHHEVVKKAISMAMDADNRSRELVSRMLATSVGDSPKSPITRAGVVSGIEILLSRVDDLHKDVPDVVHLLSCFISRAIVDEVLFPSFIDNVNLNQDSAAMVVIDKVQTLLKEKHAYRRIGKIWGMAHNRPLEELKAAIHLLIEEFFVSEDISEALVSVQELDTPYFHHEIIKQTIVLAGDRGAREIRLGRILLQNLQKSGITQDNQIFLGFHKVWSRLQDYALDAPKIAEVYNEFAQGYIDDVPIARE